MGREAGKGRNGPKRPTRTAGSLLHPIITRFGPRFQQTGVRARPHPGSLVTPVIECSGWNGPTDSALSWRVFAVRCKAMDIAE